MGAVVSLINRDLLNEDDEASKAPSDDQNLAEADGDMLDGEKEKLESNPSDLENNSNDNVSTNQGGGGFFGWGKKKVAIDPPLPDLGPPTGYYKIRDRTLKAKEASLAILGLVDLEAMDNVMEGRQVCVHPDKERISVSEDQELSIGRLRSRKDIRVNRENNIVEIQRNLVWKEKLIIMMNHNFNNVECRHIPKVDNKESRMETKSK